MMKKLKFSRFPSFRFCYIPEIRNLEISECFLLLQFSVSQKTQDSKNKKMKVWFNKKKKKFPCFPSFQFCPLPEIENSEISESFLLLQVLIVSIALSRGKA